MIKGIIKEVAKQMDLPEDVVHLAYKSQWEFIKNHIEQLPLKQDLTEEQFNELRTNFNLPSLGKFYLTYERVLRIKERFEYLKNLNKHEQDT